MLGCAWHSDIGFRLTAIISSAAALAGCYNLEAVRSLSGKLSGATATWADPSREFHASCLRSRQLGSGKDDCTIQKQATDGLLAANKILNNYFKAIEATANEQNLSVSGGVDNLTSSVAGVPGVNSDQVQAVSGLGALLARLALAGYRERTLRTLITEGAPPAHRIMEFMRTTVADNLASVLLSEKIRLTSLFADEGYIPNFRSKIGGDPAAACNDGPIANRFTNGAEYLLALEFCRRQLSIAEKEKAIANYRTSVATSEDALRALQSSKARLSSEQMARQLYAIGAELDEQVREVRSAFGGE